MRISDWSSDVCSSDLPGDQAVDVEVGRPDAVEGRQRTAEHVIAAAEHPGTFQRPEIGNAFHPAEQAFVAAAVGADGAGIAAVEVDRKSDVKGKSVSVRVDLGGCRFLKKQKQARSKYNTN